MTTQTNRFNLSLYLRREPAMLAILSLAAIFFFLMVTGISRIFHAQQTALAARWSERGVNDLSAHRYDAAIPDFRAALLYSRDDFDFRLGLAQVLMGLHRTSEAYTYLINLGTASGERSGECRAGAGCRGTGRDRAGTALLSQRHLCQLARRPGELGTRDAP